jgi:hypothetical protein
MIATLYIIIYFLFAICAILAILFWFSNLHRNHKFRVLLNVLSSLTIIFTCFAILFQAYSFNRTESDSQINIYSAIFSSLINDTIHDFQGQPQLKYYYNEFFDIHPQSGNLSLKGVKRDLIGEQQMTYLIISRVSDVIFYLLNQQSVSKIDKEATKQKLSGFIKRLKGSPIFMTNYNKLKPDLSTIVTDYLQKNYNM